MEINMTETQKEAVRSSIRMFRLPRYNEIPTVGLYLEQVTRYIGEYLSPIQEGCLTNSMVSNYVKKHLIPNTEKKQYGRDSIAYLIFIAVVKIVFSLDDAKCFIDIQKKSYEISEAYNYFCGEFERVLSLVFGNTQPDSGELAKEAAEYENDEKMMLRSAIVAVSHRLYLEKCFEVMSKAVPSDVSEKEPSDVTQNESEMGSGSICES